MIGFQAGDEVQWANGTRSGVFLRYVIINNEVWGYLVNSIFLPASLLSRYENYFTRRVPPVSEPCPIPQSGLAICKRDPALAPDRPAPIPMKGQPCYIGSRVYVQVVGGCLQLLSEKAEILLDPMSCVCLMRYIETLNVVVPDECPF